MTFVRDEDRLYDRSFLLAIVGQTCFVLGNTLMAHFARWVQFLGGDVRQVGFVMGTGSVLGLLLRPWIGQWIDRLGARAVTAIGLAAFSAGTLGNLFVTDLNWIVCLLRALIATGAAFFFSASLTYALQVAPPNRRTEAIGVLGAGGFLGMIFGPALGDLLLGQDERTRAEFVRLFALAALAPGVAAVLLLPLRRAPGRRQTQAAGLGEFLRTIRRHWPGVILLVNLAFGVCMTVPFGFLAAFVDERHLRLPGLSPVTLYFLCYAGWGLLVRVGLRGLPDRAGRRKVMFVGLAFLGGGMLGFLGVTESRAWLLALPALVSGTGHALVYHTMTALALERFPEESRGTGSALSLMMLDLGTLAGAPVLGLVADRFGFEWLFAAIGSFCFVAGCVYAWSAANDASQT